MTPFLYLVRRFLLGFFDAGVSATENSRLGFATTLSLLAVPGAIIAITMFPKYSALLRALKKQYVFNPDITSIPDKYIFIVLSITITGIVTVLKWDTLFPDRRDFANLAPLPIETRSILYAKAIALAIFGLVFVIDVNAVSTLVFPMIVMENRGTVLEVIRFVIAHMTAVGGAGLWTFTTFLAITGVMMVVLPYGVFRRAKRYVQFASLVSLLLLFFTATGMGPELEALMNGESNWASYLPSVWFLGLYHNVQGKSVGPIDALGSRAVLALGASLLLAIVAYGLSYRRYFLKAAESTDIAMHALRFPDWAFRLLDTTVLRSHFDRACFRFVLKTLARSDRHTASLTSLLGLGAALAVSTVNYGLDRGNIGLALIPSSLFIVYSLLTGLRLCFGVPSDLRSNWVFQICAEDEADPHGTVQRVMLLLVSPVILATAAVFVMIWGWELALLHVLFVTCASLLLVEFLTLEFRVIPFTCSWMPGAGNVVFALAMFVVGLLVFGQGMGSLEVFLLRHRMGFFPFLIFVAIVLFAFRHTRNARERIVYQDTRGQLDLLHISD